ALGLPFQKANESRAKELPIADHDLADHDLRLVEAARKAGSRLRGKRACLLCRLEGANLDCPLACPRAPFCFRRRALNARRLSRADQEIAYIARRVAFSSRQGIRNSELPGPWRGQRWNRARLGELQLASALEAAIEQIRHMGIPRLRRPSAHDHRNQAAAVPHR